MEVHSYSTGDLGKQHIAGIWRLRSTIYKNKERLLQYPLKEFTVYPKPKKPSPPIPRQTVLRKEKEEEDLFLVLREDGKFVQSTNYPLISSHRSIQKKISKSNKSSFFAFLRNITSKTSTQPQTKKEEDNCDDEEEDDDSFMEGTWDFVDGKLILATDRPQKNHRKKYTENQYHYYNQENKIDFQQKKDNSKGRATKRPRDTILMGKVVASSGERLIDNPALLQKQKEEENLRNMNITSSLSLSSPTNSQSIESQQKLQEGKQISHSIKAKTDKKEEDVHLSVPQGKVRIGKYTYPKTHPSFFEQPMMFQSQSVNEISFSLQQVLGSLNTIPDSQSHVPKEVFKKQDLMNKRYFLTSYPLPNVRKRKQRWSIKYNKYVDDKPKTKEELIQEQKELNSSTLIKSFEVQLFANNTFTTIKGLGDMTLRGKWWIIGNDRDQLWMQVWRFGFGRSVSGSTFSEGSTLSQKDEVGYWGKIYKVGKEGESSVSTSNDKEDSETARVEINGSVMDGLGLEPCPVGRFTMIEKTEDDDNFYEDEEEDDDEEDDEDDISALSDDIGVFE